MARFHSTKVAILLIALTGMLAPRIGWGLERRWDLLSSRELGERWQTACEDRDTRFERTLGNWFELHNALEELTPRDATIVILLRESRRSKEEVLRIGHERKLLFPRGVNGKGTYQRTYTTQPEVLSARVFVANLQPEISFLGQERFEQILEGELFTLWRYRGVN